jgi:O-antigen/teichoic acid export membrane protein
MQQQWRKAMKKISLIGLVLGAVLGIVAGLMAGIWLFWLGMGLVAGVLIGSAGARRSRLPRSNTSNIHAGNLNM